MIGKFLQEKSGAEENPENGNFQAEEKPSPDILTLPEIEDLTAREPADQIPVFRDAGDIIEPVPLPENQKTQTAAPVGAIVGLTAPVQMKTETYQETPAENMRRTGLAWTAATVLVGSVVFMMVIGWIFDLIFGSSPWGMVGGITLGAVIGFVQLFRITSQIFKKEENTSIRFTGDKD